MTSNDAVAQASLARQTLALFVERGESLTDGRHIIHYFYGDADRLPALRSELEKGGYSVSETAAASGLTAETIGVINENWADETMEQMCGLADRFIMEYDGWEASMVRHPQLAAPARKVGWLKTLFGRRD